MRSVRSSVFAAVLALALVGSATEIAGGEGQPESMVWTRLGRAFGGGQVSELVALPGGAMLAVGSVGATSARVWHSPDGVSWQEIQLPDRDHTWAKHAAASESGVIAVGIRSKPGQRAETVVWTSPDGLQWSGSRVVDQAVPVAALATDDGFAIVTTGALMDAPRPITVWHSADGVEWQASPVSDGPTDIQAVAAARTAAGAWLVAGVVPDETAWLWRSDDGTTWEVVPRSAGWLMGRLAVVPTGFLLISSRVQDHEYLDTVVLHSADGGEWSEVATLEEPTMALAAGPTGVVSLTNPPDRYRFGRKYPVTMRWSENGRSWMAVEVPEFQGKPFKRVALLPGGQVLAVRQLNDITWLGRPSDAPPVVFPEPTPDERGKLLNFRALVKRGDHPEGDYGLVSADIVDYFERAGDDLDPLHLESPIDDLVQECKRFMRRDDDRFWCAKVFLRLHLAHGRSRDPLPYELADRWLGVTMHGKHEDAHRKDLIMRIKWNRVAHPDWFKD